MYYDKGEPNPFELLGVPLTATTNEIKKSYRKIVIKYHPDKTPKGQEINYTQIFNRITKAYKELIGDFDIKSRASRNMFNKEQWIEIIKRRKPGIKQQSIKTMFFQKYNKRQRIALYKKFLNRLVDIIEDYGTVSNLKDDWLRLYYENGLLTLQQEYALI